LFLGDLDIGLVVAVEEVLAVAELVGAGHDRGGGPVDTTRSMCDSFSSCLDLPLES
jgi:hypothetical protein